MQKGLKLIVGLAVFFSNCLVSALVEQLVVEQPMVVIIASYKNAKYYKGNLDSVFNQHYKNYRVIYISDNDYAPDSDRTGELVEKYVAEKNQGHRFTLVRNHKRHLALRNLYRALLSLKHDEIAVFLDGDDELAHSDVLTKVNEMYSNSQKEVWYTYGNFGCLLNKLCSTWTQEIPREVVDNNNFRAWQGMATHLRTCRAWLAHQIAIEDLFYDNDMYKMTYDVALYEPMMEMAAERYDWTTETLYNYNDDTAFNDHSVNWFLQLFLSQRIRAKRPYSRLTSTLSHEMDKQIAYAKADVVIFSHNNAQGLRQVLQDMRAKYASVGSIAVVYKASSGEAANAYKQLLCQFPDVVFIGWPEGEILISPFMDQCMKSDAKYVILMNDKGRIVQRNAKDAIRWLEMTHASGFYLNLTYPIVSAATLAVELTLDESMPQTVYAFRHAPVISLLDFSAQGLYRKSDMVPKFKAWRFKLGYLSLALQDVMAGGGVSLFYQQ